MENDIIGWLFLRVLDLSYCLEGNKFAHFTLYVACNTPKHCEKKKIEGQKTKNGKKTQ